jgi:hypothetical protein
MHATTLLNWVFQPNTTAPTCWWQHILHKDEDGLLGTQLDPLADHVHKLPDSQI